jgi:hypothetical protein
MTEFDPAVRATGYAESAVTGVVIGVFAHVLFDRGEMCFFRTAGHPFPDVVARPDLGEWLVISDDRDIAGQASLRNSRFSRIDITAVAVRSAHKA